MERIYVYNRSFIYKTYVGKKKRFKLNIVKNKMRSLTSSFPLHLHNEICLTYPQIKDYLYLNREVILFQSIFFLLAH